MRTLLADDEHEFVAVRTKILESWGFDVVSFEFESTATAFIEDRSDEIDIAILDMKMESDFSGLSLVGRLTELAPAVPSVVLTGYGSIENDAACTEAGAFSYIRKEDARELLLSKLRLAVNQRLLRLKNQLQQSMMTLWSMGMYYRLRRPTVPELQPLRDLWQVMYDCQRGIPVPVVLPTPHSPAVSLGGLLNDRADLPNPLRLSRLNVLHEDESQILNESVIRTESNSFPRPGAIWAHLLKTAGSGHKIDVEWHMRNNWVVAEIRTTAVRCDPTRVRTLNRLLAGMSVGVTENEEREIENYIGVSRFALDLTALGGVAWAKQGENPGDVVVTIKIPTVEFWAAGKDQKTQQ